MFGGVHDLNKHGLLFFSFCLIFWGNKVFTSVMLHLFLKLTVQTSSSLSGVCSYRNKDHYEVLFPT